ncbi:hypothetical protein [Arthrobacter sp. zg-Y877]|uniref:hypothetical protein n=1 Tax=Arthrobacter sp. zg-Y877 TaxID=3049074 RepID=UPI0025A4831B|nr:hypothetical protein [Arthrobacter sp. zg-Y877]MDM7989031.1 hypothetical protein [Arthrobacter sp. zg-Y877]
MTRSPRKAQRQHDDGGSDPGEHQLQQLILNEGHFPRFQTDERKPGGHGNTPGSSVTPQMQQPGGQVTAAATPGKEETGKPPVGKRGTPQHGWSGM